MISQVCCSRNLEAQTGGCPKVALISGCCTLPWPYQLHYEPSSLRVFLSHHSAERLLPYLETCLAATYQSPVITCQFFFFFFKASFFTSPPLVLWQSPPLTIDAILSWFIVWKNEPLRYKFFHPIITKSIKLHMWKGGKNRMAACAQARNSGELSRTQGLYRLSWEGWNFPGWSFQGWRLVDVTSRDWAFYSIGLRAGSSSEGS